MGNHTSMKLETNKIYQGDSLAVLKTFPDNCIDMVMTSPPYYALRDYKVEGQLGSEDTYQEFIAKLITIFDEVKRVLKKEGTIWVNLGDTYCGGCGGPQSWERLSQDKEWDDESEKNPHRNDSGYTSKCLFMVPERFAIGMIEHGWILRNKNIWYKRNSMPSSTKDRFCNKWEYVFMFSKSKKYYFDMDSVRVPLKNGNYKEFNKRVRDVALGKIMSSQYKATSQEVAKYKGLDNIDAEALGSPRAREVRYNSKYETEMQRNMANRMDVKRPQGVSHDDALTNVNGGNPGDVWDITTKGHPFAHFAVYPEKLCETPIKCGCPKDGVVLDPFIGSGTTGLVALKLNRKFVGIELSPEYIKIAMKRLQPWLIQKRIGDEFNESS